MRRWSSRSSRSRVSRQLSLPFQSRMERWDRRFKRGIIGLTALIALGLLGGTGPGRYATSTLAYQLRWGTIQLIGGEIDRSEFEAQRHRERLRGIEVTRKALRKAARDRGPAMENFLRVTEMDADSAVLRWGNYDWTLVLSSAVFDPDDQGRSYRLRPNTRSVWITRLTLHNAPAIFLIPDTEEARAAAVRTGGRVIEESVQTTNSWGYRGPEPDRSAAVRGIVLGDSVMQGAFVGDEETPPACLERELAEGLGTSVSILNTGHLGYSPEQYYHTLIETFDRFQPHFVIIGVCSNDFGDMQDPANWEETEYQLDRISQFCRSQGVFFFLVPAPDELDLLGRRNASVYPGLVSRVYKQGGTHYVDPIEAFADEYLRLWNEAARQGEALAVNPLYNGHIGDKHFSPVGSSIWAQVVSKRLLLVWERQDLIYYLNSLRKNTLAPADG
ncbi:hypothetical protein BH23PLA1_BH23PLA1_20410 [soil metagenome]